jgi:hypothetical protein
MERFELKLIQVQHDKDRVYENINVFFRKI